MDQLVAWVMAHQGIVAGAAVAVLDLVFALNPKADSNGFLHFFYVTASKLAGKKPEA